VRAYASGVRFRWLEGELSAAAAGKLGRLATMPRRPTAGAMWAADDPVPAALLAAHAVRVRAARRVPGR
jgi:hypothetical protein